MMDAGATLLAMGLRAFRKNTLYVNALFLMLSAFVAAGSGLVFWVLVTRSYDASAVGLSTTLLTVSSLLSLLCLAGFDTALVRFLPRAGKHKNDYINSAYIIVTVLSSALAAGFGVVLPMLLPSLSILTNPWAFVGFVVFTAAGSLIILTNAVFLALKQARYIFIINTIFGAAKVLLVLFMAHGSAMTIFVTVGGAQIVGLAFGVAWMRRNFGYRFSPRLHMGAVRAVRKFSLSVYASSILNLLPPTLLPLLIVYHLGLESAAYYYMAFTIAGVLYTIAYASMQSMFAEGSHNEGAMGAHIKRAARLIGILLVPATALVVILSNFLLTTFGDEYAAQASTLLQLLALGALPVAIYSGLGAIFKVTKNLLGVVVMNVVYAVVILGLSFWLIDDWGLAAVGWAWIIGNTAAYGVGAIFLIKKINKR